MKQWLPGDLNQNNTKYTKEEQLLSAGNQELFISRFRFSYISFADLMVT